MLFTGSVRVFTKFYCPRIMQRLLNDPLVNGVNMLIISYVTASASFIRKFLRIGILSMVPSKMLVSYISSEREHDTCLSC